MCIITYIHTVEVGEQILALDIFGHQTHLAVGRLISVQISKADLEHTALK